MANQTSEWPYKAQTVSGFENPFSSTRSAVHIGLSQWTFFFMAVAAVSGLLVLSAKGLDGLAIVAGCAVPFYYRNWLFDRIERKLDPTAVSGIFIPGFFAFASGNLAFGLTLGFFMNAFIKPDMGLAGLLPLFGGVVSIAVPIKVFRWALWRMNLNKIDVLTVREKEKFPLATGWADPAAVLKRFNHPTVGDFKPEHIKGIHIGNGIHWNEQGHMLTLGGSGQGKGVSLVLPALLSDGFVRAGISLVCLDPKGENAAVAAPHLRRAGYNVHIINPFGIEEIADLGNSRWNPFDLAEKGDDKKFCDILAYSLHNRRSNGDGEFFNARCRQYISLYAQYVLHEKRRGGAPVFSSEFQRLYYFLKLSGEMREELLARMAGDYAFTGHMDAEAILSRVTSSSVKTEDSIFSTIEEAINVLADQRLQASLAASDFDLRQIAQKPTAIFICVRHDELEYYATWIRIFVDALLKTLNRYYNPSRKVLVLLDEFAQLGYIDQFAKAPAILRGYNVTLWPIVQYVGQLVSLYGRENSESFIGNSAIKHYFGGYGGSIDNMTADYIARRMPKTVNIQYNESNGEPRGYERPLLDAAGVIGYEKIICEALKVSAPFEVEKIPYWQWKFAKHNASPNPFHRR